MSFQHLRTFGTGYAVRTLVLNNKYILDNNIMYDDVDIHVLLCMITMMTQNANLDMGTLITSHLQDLPIVTAFLP